MKLLAVIFAILVPAFAAAQMLPALYDVTGVASDDVLNIRRQPKAGATIVGLLAYDQTSVEITGLDTSGRWGLVNTAEGAGWTSMRYLVRQPGQDFSTLPRPLFCAGTEPFWDLRITTTATADFKQMGEPPRQYTDLWAVPAANQRAYFAVMAEDARGSFTAMVRSASCSDGMSDRHYGLAIGVLRRDLSGTSFVTGCCSLNR